MQENTKNILFTSDFHLLDKNKKMLKNVFKRKEGFSPINLLKENSNSIIYFLGDMITGTITDATEKEIFEFQYFKSFIKKNYKKYFFIKGNHDVKELYGQYDVLYDYIDIPFYLEGEIYCARLTHVPMIVPNVIYSDNPSTPFPIVLNIYGHLHNIAKVESKFPGYLVTIDPLDEVDKHIISLNEIINIKTNEIKEYINTLKSLNIL